MALGKTDQPVELRRRSTLAMASGTGLRFILLCAAASMIVMIIANNVGLALEHVDRTAIGAYMDCTSQRMHDLVETRRVTGEWPTHRRQCVSPYGSKSLGAWPPWIGLVVFWSAVVTITWRLPAWRIRRRRYEGIGLVAPRSTPTTNRDHPESSVPLSHGAELLAALTECQHSTDLDAHVTYLLDPLDARCSALAFGRPGRRYVALSQGLVLLANRNPGHFRAVVMHELAHIRNRDLDIGFLTIVAWRITLPLLAMTVPSTVLQPLNWSATSPAVYVLGLVSAAMLLTLTVSVPLLRNSVLRSRELFADARAKQWAGNTASIDAMLAAYFPKKRRWYPEALRIHPSLIRRQAVLLNDRLLAVTSAWEWIAVGLMAMMVRYELRQFVGSSPFISDLLGITVAAVFVTIALGLAAWANIDRGEDPESREKSSRTAGLGLGMGLALSASLLQPDVATAVLFVGVSALGSFLLWIPFMCLAAWVARRWLSTVTSSWAEVMATQVGRSAKTAFWAVLSVATIPVSLGLCILLQALQFSLYAPISSKGGLLGGTELFFNLLAFFLTPSPATISLLLIAVALPLAGQVIRQKRRGWKPVPRNQIELFRPVPFGIFSGIALGWLAGFLVIPLVFIAANLNPIDAPLGFGVLVLAQMVAAVAMTNETCDPYNDYACSRWHQSLIVATSSSLSLGITPLMEFKIIEWGFGWPVQGEARASVLYGAVMPLGVVLGGLASAVTLALRHFRSR